MDSNTPKDHIEEARKGLDAYLLRTGQLKPRTKEEIKYAKAHGLSPVGRKRGKQ